MINTNTENTELYLDNGPFLKQKKYSKFAIDQILNYQTRFFVLRQTKNDILIEYKFDKLDLILIWLRYYNIKDVDIIIDRYIFNSNLEYIGIVENDYDFYLDYEPDKTNFITDNNFKNFVDTAINCQAHIEIN